MWRHHVDHGRKHELGGERLFGGLDKQWPITEAEVNGAGVEVRSVPKGDIRMQAELRFLRLFLYKPGFPKTFHPREDVFFMPEWISKSMAIESSAHEPRNTFAKVVQIN